MTANVPNSPYLNFTHMFDMTDRRGQLPINATCPNSILYILENEPDFSLFHSLVKRADQQGIFNNLQADFTLFVPSNKMLKMRGMDEGYFVNFDKNKANNIVKALTINKRLPSEVLEYTPAMYLYCIDKINRLFITTDKEKNLRINNDINVIYKDMLAKNGIIHVIDGFFDPYDN